MISERVALLRIFEDSDLKKALAEFFEAQAITEKASASDAMGQDHPDEVLARKHACYAKAYEEAMNRLKDYARHV